MSSSVKMPLLLPLPMKVKNESNVSVRLKAKIASNAIGIFDASWKRVPMPLKPAPKVVPSSWNGFPMAWMSVFSGERSVTPRGMPMRVVAMMPMRIAPLPFRSIKTMEITKPMTANIGTVELISTN